jgi:hypothetical protein
MTDEEHQKLQQILKVRLTVGFLGERAQFDWWPTAFYEASSRLFLEPVFARTARLAQYHGVLEAARRLHDEHLSTGSHHLFRLPEEAEQDLHGLLQSTIGGTLATQATHDQEAALLILKDAAGEGAAPGNREGPMAVGSVDGLYSPPTLRAIAAGYLYAFEHHTKAYPYLQG